MSQLFRELLDLAGMPPIAFWKALESWNDFRLSADLAKEAEKEFVLKFAMLKRGIEELPLPTQQELATR